MVALTAKDEATLRSQASRLVVISGPSSGAGKGKVIDGLKAITNLRLWQSTSMTTRARRSTETHSHQYNFVSLAEFTALEDRNGFLEANGVTEGNRYGTPLAPVIEHLGLGEVVLLEIEVHGAKAVNSIVPDALFIFIKPTNGDLDDDIAELRRRIHVRGTEDEQSIKKRLVQARGELELAQEFGFYTWVVNETGKSELAAQKIDQLVQARQH